MQITKLLEKKRCIRQLLKMSLQGGLNVIQSPIFLPSIFLFIAMTLQSTGFCADENTEMTTLTDRTINTLFSPWIRKAALAFAGGFGLFQSYMAGSVKPLLSWGGLGLAVNYIPKIIDVITKVGG